MMIGPVAFWECAAGCPFQGCLGHAAPASRPLDTILGPILIPALPNLNRYKNSAIPGAIATRKTGPASKERCKRMPPRHAPGVIGGKLIGGNDESDTRLGSGVDRACRRFGSRQ